jgi:hypothetical protein
MNQPPPNEQTNPDLLRVMKVQQRALWCWKCSALVAIAVTLVLFGLACAQWVESFMIGASAEQARNDATEAAEATRQALESVEYLRPPPTVHVFTITSSKEPIVAKWTIAPRQPAAEEPAQEPTPSPDSK